MSFIATGIAAAWAVAPGATMAAGTWGLDKLLGVDWGGKRAGMREEALAGAKQVKEEQLALLAEQETSTTEYMDYQAGAKRAQTGLGAGTGIAQTEKSLGSVYKKGKGLASIGEAEQMAKTTTKGILNKYTTQMQDIFAGREYQREQARISGQQQRIGIEREFQTQIQNY